MTTPSSSKAWNVLSWMAILLLSGLSLYLWNDRAQLKQNIENQRQELTQVNEFYDDLEKEFSAATEELNNLKTDNVELNNLIESQKAELRSQKNRIARLARENKDLGQARIELNAIRQRVSSYIAQIEELKSQNQALANSNFSLREEKKILTGEIEKERKRTEEIMESKTLLVSENENLQAERDQLFVKVSAASVIDVADIQVQGYKIKGNGKLTKKTRAKKVNIVQVCFKATKNLVTDAGTESFMVRIINPMGETLFLENKGSGVLHTSDADQVRYTGTVDIEYQNTEAPVCMQWQPELPFMKGKYQVEIYNKGYKVGASIFELK